MQAYDTNILAGQLNALCEVFDKKPVSLKGVEVWFDTLKEFPTERVMGTLLSWPKAHTKFPAPADVWKVVNERCIDLREKKAAEERKAQPFSQPGVGGAQAEKFIAKMREVLKQPKWTPREHWQNVLKTQKKGSIGYEYATKALIMKGVLKDPTPKIEDHEDPSHF